MWPRAKLKFVARLGYGDALPSDEPLEGAFRVFGSNGPFASLSRANTRKPAIIIGRKGSYGKVNWTAEPCFASDTTFFVDESTSRNHLRWVYWLLQTLRLDEGTDEAAVPGLNRETAYNREVLVPTLSEQCAIANYLDRETARLDTLVTAKEHLLDLIAEKRRALITRAVTRGVGAMGWQSLQTHPDPAARGNERGIEEGGGEDHAVSAGRRDVAAGEAERKPAIIIGRKGSYGKVNWTAEPCFASDTTFFVDESTSRNHLRWVYWLLQTLRLDEGTDEAAVPGLNRETAYNREVLVPTLSEQCAIANYLDRETARLDTLVTAKEHLLDLIAEKRRALITRAVTRGVGAMGWQSLQTHPDPAARGNERGIEEGGGEDHAVSAGGDGVMWPRAKLKFVARLGYGDALPSDEPLEGAFRVFGSNGPFASLSRANTRKPAIIIGRKGSYGKVNWTAEPCFASDTTFFVDESTSRNHLRWVYWLLQTLRLDEGTDEAAVPGLNRETAYNREVLVPTLSEQCAIANYLDRETARLDTLSSMTEETIALLKERRAAVIAAAVTGRIDMKEKE